MRYVSGIERGEENPSLAALVKLAAAVEAHPRDLFADQG
jgi:transcriptional regulator with XRE-family HTH domain